MIKKIGGSNPGNYVRAVCRKTLDPGLIYNNFSWSRTRNLNKRKFNSTSVCNEIIGNFFIFQFKVYPVSAYNKYKKPNYCCTLFCFRCNSFGKTYTYKQGN